MGLYGILPCTLRKLVLPLFLQHYKNASPEELDLLKPILGYSFAVNHAFDYVYTAAYCLSIGCWSVAISYGLIQPATL